MPAKGNAISTNTKTGKRNPVTIMKNGSTIVSHTETYGVNITGSSDFEVTSVWALQPGISAYSKGTPLGSWLPQIAVNFDSYEIQSLRFNYRAACSTLQPGLAMFAFEPNPEGSTPGSYQELRNMMSVDGSVHANLAFEVGSRCRKELLTRKGNVVNLPSYDAGKVYFATVGCDAGAKLGFIDVTYTVRLFNPQSSLSTTVPNITYEQLRPVFRFLWSPAADTTSNVSTDCFQASTFLLQGGTASGATDLATSVVRNFSALTVNAYNGCSFGQTAKTGWQALRVNYSGRYRLRAVFNGDFKDLNLFALAPFRAANSTSLEALCSRAVLSSATGQTTVDLQVVPTTGRGFTGTAVGDPNPGTDLALYGTWDVDLQQGELVSIGMGVRTYNSVSTTGNTYIARLGTGPSFIELEFLGPT